jgi:hypothetical protein
LVHNQKLHSNNNNNNSYHWMSTMRSMSTSPPSAATATTAAVLPTWDDLKKGASNTPVGTALDRDLELRAKGRGSPNVHSKLRVFGGDSDNPEHETTTDTETETETESPPVFTLYRDHAGWCP